MKLKQIKQILEQLGKEWGEVPINKKLLAKQAIEINYLDKNFNNCIFNIVGLVIKEAGRLSFIVKKDNKQIAKHECMVDIETKIKPKIKEKK